MVFFWMKQPVLVVYFTLVVAFEIGSHFFFVLGSNSIFELLTSSIWVTLSFHSFHHLKSASVRPVMLSLSVRVTLFHWYNLYVRSVVGSIFAVSCCFAVCQSSEIAHI